MKKVKTKKKIFLIIVSLIVIIIFGLVITAFFLNKKDYFKIESRADKVASEKNKDDDFYETVGWIRVQGTNIDMPVIVVKDENTEYQVEKEKYAWSTNIDGKYYNKMNIMGHNILNLSSLPQKSSKDFKRFEEIMAYVYEDFANENEYIQLTINDKEYIYKIFSVGFIPQIDVSLFPKGENSEEQLASQLNIFKNTSIYDYDVDVNTKDSFISLITCTRFFGIEKYLDFVVTGRLLREDEKIQKYNMKKNSKYKELEKIWDGEYENEKENIA